MYGNYVYTAFTIDGFYRNWLLKYYPRPFDTLEANKSHTFVIRQIQTPHEERRSRGMPPSLYLSVPRIFGDVNSTAAALIKNELKRKKEKHSV